MSFADFFRPRYRHSDPTIRAEAIEDLDVGDVSILKSVVLNDKDDSIRRLAIDRIKDPQTLSEVASSISEPKLKARAQKRAAKLWVGRAVKSKDDGAFAVAIGALESLGDKNAIGQVVAKVEQQDKWKRALSKIDDERALAELVRSVANKEKRQACLTAIRSESTLRTVALEAKYKDSGISAVERIESQKDLELLIAKASHKAVKNAAKRKLNQLQGGSPKAVAAVAEPQVADEYRRTSAVQSQLTLQMEKFAAGNEWVDSKERVETLSQEWSNLSVAHLDAEKTQRFETAVSKYWARREKYGKGADTILAKRVLSEVETDTPVDDSSSFAPTEKTVRDTEAAGTQTAKSPEKKERVDPRKAAVEQAKQRLSLFVETLTESQDEKNIGKLSKLASEAKDNASYARKIEDKYPELKSKFDELRQALIVKLGELREAEDWQRWANVGRQEAVIAEAQKLLESEERGLAAKLKRLQRSFKEAGPVPRSKNQELWDKFKTISDQVYDKVKEERKVVEFERKENLQAKRTLCEQAESLRDSTDWDATAAEMKKLQESWKSIGPVPKKYSEEIWQRFRTACDAFFENRKPHLDSRLKEQNDNLAKKTALLEKAKQLATSEDWETTGKALRDLQKEWKEVGHVPRENANEINKGFREACDSFYKSRDAHRTKQLQEKQTELQEWQQGVASLSSMEATAESKDAALALRQKLFSLDLPNDKRKTFFGQLNTGIASLMAKDAGLFAGSELDATDTKTRKEKLLNRAEELAACRKPKVEADLSSTIDIAATLQNALQENALGVEPQTPDGRSFEAVVEELQEAWQRLGPVPGDEGLEMESLFKKRCDLALGKMPRKKPTTDLSSLL